MRCSHLGLDNHPAIVAGAIAAVERYGSLHWSCARTRLNFGLIGDLESTLSQLFRAHVIAYSTVMVANMGALPKPIVAQETQVETIPHNDLNALEQICRKHSVVAYVCDGVYTMGGFAPTEELLLCSRSTGFFSR